MSNEVVKVEESSVLSLFNQKTEETKENLQSVTVSNYVPNLTVAYATSDCVKKTKIAELGDFVLGGMTTLGPTIELSILDYRLHAVVWDKNKKEVVSEAYHLPRKNGESYSPKDDPEWMAYISQKLPYGQELQQGADMFVYLPKHNMFGSFFMKKTIGKFIQPLMAAADRPRIAKVTTVYAEYKGNSWYNLAITETSNRLDPSTIPLDIADKYHKIFLDPNKGIETVSADQAAPERVR